MRTDSPVALATVVAARSGDQRAMDDLVAGCLPLVYNIVGRALSGHADVDDVVQETMLRVVRGLAGLVDPTSFRSWLVAVAMSQVRERHRAASLQNRAAPPAGVDPTVGGYGSSDLDDLADPGADFVDLTILRLELTGQRREVVRATRWLDSGDQEVLSLWWLEVAGALTRAEVAGALELSREHAAVTIQRTRARLEIARAVVRALEATPRCGYLADLVDGWDGRPDALWRKRLARHTRECDRCGRAPAGLVAADRLLAGVPFVLPPASLQARLAAHGAAAHGASAAHGAAAHGATAARGWLRLLRRYALPHPVIAVTTTVATVAAAAIAVAAYSSPAVPAHTAATVGSPRPAATASAEPSPQESAAASSPAPTPSASSASSSATSAPAAPVAAKSAKKGVSAWYFDGVGKALTDVRASWCYTWAADPGKTVTPAGVEFVPMIWGADSVTPANLAKAKSEGKVLLGFNEPDMSSQANMTAARALELWPQLIATGMRLGSPSVAYGADTPGGWLDQFMTGAKSHGYRVDFITLHWYGSDFSSAATGQIQRYIQATYDRYHVPIWLTEYALIKFSGGTVYPTQAQQAAFVTASTQMLEGLAYVERYAWFALPTSKAGDTGLYGVGGVPTTVGAAYRAAGPAR